MPTKSIWERFFELRELLEFCVLCFNARTEELDYILQLCHLIWLRWSAYMGPVLIREDFSPLLLQEDEVLSGLPANRALQHLHRFCSSVLKGGFLCGILSDHWVLLCPWSIQPQWRKLWPRGQRWLWRMLWQGRLWYIRVQVSSVMMVYWTNRGGWWWCWELWIWILNVCNCYNHHLTNWNQQ